MRLPRNTTILIADGGGALFYRNAGDADHVLLDLIESAGNETGPARELGRDRAGRFTTPNGGSAAVEIADRHVAQEARFAAYVAKRADAVIGAKSGRLVVLAPPKFLGQLRRFFSSRLQDRLLASMPLDLRNHPTCAIERALRAA
jgi:protein required for attachment to host cells